MAAQGTAGGSLPNTRKEDPIFEDLGSKVEGMNVNKDEQSIGQEVDVDDAGPLYEIESLCMNCEETVRSHGLVFEHQNSLIHCNPGNDKTASYQDTLFPRSHSGIVRMPLLQHKEYLHQISWPDSRKGLPRVSQG